jgi:hypothetical protein
MGGLRPYPYGCMSGRINGGLLHLGHAPGRDAIVGSEKEA